jgi:hypothetical protein
MAIMAIDDPKIESLRTMASGVQEEFDLAINFHEVWRPAAYDDALHQRLRGSFAANAFFVVRVALRREMLLALMRIWDTNHAAISLERVANITRDKRVVRTLAVERAARFGSGSYYEDAMYEDLSKQAVTLCEVVDKYAEGGACRSVWERLRELRDERLAHRSKKEVGFAASADTTDEEIEALYQDTLAAVKELMSLALATAIDPQDNADVCRHHAGYFWAPVRSERTEGHPNYRA